ncbi:hypothetical protein KC347_g135 [Hortaea werneckii]|nr:hypothetical protein KC347_g135 [Hortaea werneckii]
MFGLLPLGVALRLLMIMLSRSSRSVCSAVISLMMEAGERGSTISPAVSYLPAHDMTHVFGREFPSSYLERSSHSEDTVVGLLGTQTLESLLHNLILLGDQVVGTVSPPWVSTVLGVPSAPIPAVPLCLLLSILGGLGTYRRPSFRYPALSKYHSLSGRIQRINHGRFIITVALSITRSIFHPVRCNAARQASPPDEEDRVSKTSRGTMASEEKQPTTRLFQRTPHQFKGGI